MKTRTIAVVDYGAGNLPSVERALHRLGARTLRAVSPQTLAADAIVLPGVGHFSALIRALKRLHLLEALIHAITRGVPFLGICLGLQALYESSEEAPGESGLGLLPGKVTPLPATVKSPHMGWNQVRHLRPSRLLQGLPGDTYFYFAHSFAAASTPAAVAVCDYGADFAAVVEQGDLFAVQFHPEKSGKAGNRVLSNFLELLP